MSLHSLLRFFGLGKPGPLKGVFNLLTGRTAAAVAFAIVAAATAVGQQQVPAADVFPVPGEPPLTRLMVDKGAKLFEWLLDARLTQEQYEQFQDSLVRSWKTNNREEIAGSVGVIQLYDALGQKTEAEREAFRETLRNKYLEAMRQTPNDVGSQWALGIYYSAHTPIADGNPPLTRQVADAYAEVMCFMISEVLGGEAFKPDKSYKDLLASSLATQYSGLPPSRQKEFSEMPMAWASIRLNWPKLSAAEHAKYRQEWTPGVRALLPPPAAENNVRPTGSRSAAVTSTPPRSGSSARDVMRDFASRERTRQMLYNMNQDYLHKYVLSPGWTYMKYSTW